jgi:hypothetical protein
MTAGPIEQHIEGWLPDLAEPVELPDPAWTRAPVRVKEKPRVDAKTRKKRRRR